MGQKLSIPRGRSGGPQVEPPQTRPSDVSSRGRPQRAQTVPTADISDVLPRAPQAAHTARSPSRPVPPRVEPPRPVQDQHSTASISQRSPTGALPTYDELRAADAQQGLPTFTDTRRADGEQDFATLDDNQWIRESNCAIVLYNVAIMQRNNAIHARNAETLRHNEAVLERFGRVSPDVVRHADLVQARNNRRIADIRRIDAHNADVLERNASVTRYNAETAVQMCNGFAVLHFTHALSIERLRRFKSVEPLLGEHIPSLERLPYPL